MERMENEKSKGTEEGRKKMFEILEDGWDGGRNVKIKRDQRRKINEEELQYGVK